MGLRNLREQWFIWFLRSLGTRIYWWSLRWIHWLCCVCWENLGMFNIPFFINPVLYKVLVFLCDILCFWYIRLALWNLFINILQPLNLILNHFFDLIIIIWNRFSYPIDVLQFWTLLWRDFTERLKKTVPITRIVENFLPWSGLKILYCWNCFWFFEMWMIVFFIWWSHIPQIIIFLSFQYKVGWFWWLAILDKSLNWR